MGWSLGEKLFKNSWKQRIKLFDLIPKGSILYAAEIWGWKKSEEIERIQKKYIKWTLGIDKNTPDHVLYIETKRNKLEIEAGKRAIKYEEKIAKMEKGLLKDIKVY